MIQFYVATLCSETSCDAIALNVGKDDDVFATMTIEEKRNAAPWPFFSEEEIQVVAEILRSGKVNYWTGQHCRAFEQEFADYIGVDHAVALANGTVALEAALESIGVSTGDEVITTSRTFIATASAIVRCGGVPVFADVDRDSQNITASTIAEKITPKTKAIIVVHLAGWPCAMDEIVALAKTHNLFLIEDCAQAHGAKYKDRYVGSWGDIAAFSFCQDKIMTTGGEGGMVTTNHREIWKKIWSLKDHGKNVEALKQSKAPCFRWLHDHFGTNWRMTEMQAAIGRIQLKKLPEWVEDRQKNAGILRACFKNIRGLRIPQPEAFTNHAYYKFYAFIVPSFLERGWDRKKILSEMKRYGVPCFSGSCSEIYLEKAFTEGSLKMQMRLPVARELGETSLMFLVHPTYSEEALMDVGHIAQSILQRALKSG